MASKHDGFVRPAWWIATALAALGWWFGSGLQPIWWLTWLAPLPVLWLAPRVRAPWAALAALVAFAVGGLNQWAYLHTYIGLPLPIIVNAIGMPSVAMTLCVLLFRRLLLRGHIVAAALAMPTAWIAVEYVNSLLSPHGTFGSIGYTQMDALPILQVAAVTGIWGIGFLVFLLPTAIAVQVAPQATKRGRLAVAAIAVLSIVVTVACGSWRLHAPPLTTLRIGLVSLEKPIRPSLSDTDGQTLAARYVDAIDRLANEGARIAVIPETSFATTDATVPMFVALATKHNMTVGVGIDFKGDPRAERNMLTVFQPGAISPVTYDKHHLIPGFEHQYTPGDSYSLLAGTPRIGLAICKDMDFHDTGRAYALRDAQLLLVPAWDFSIDGWLHSRMAIMRGVESGFAIARVARSGRLTLSDDRGRVVAEASSEKHDAELVGDLPLHETQTLYARWGDWFVWLDLIALVAWLVLALRRQSPPGTSPPR
ncbi:apolipoprotein N-acyltransferase [Luteibacter rhizovicinus]|uniref:Apolipoprotein N-acyltransferase n=1 Tax=Luteibacter rhizovicinus TaxID=242606 RepID=A0A4R3YVF2_9GAMM|nr:nitrilase-related carbon-nitrogen hydrolase [Luteibacter rhizovicinus]TCV96426.1 apolipoprotein N-acyltransferase [Luteibacter rhizovicinus]